MNNQLKWVVIVGLAVAFGHCSTHPRTSDNKHEIPWLVQTTTSGNMIGSLIPNQPGFTTMLCEATAASYAETHAIPCHPAIKFPTPNGLK